jgi:polysaccharide biosynthesis/export protein ExoF
VDLRVYARIRVALFSGGDKKIALSCFPFASTGCIIVKSLFPDVARAVTGTVPAIILSASLLAGPFVTPSQAEYKLGPQDKIRVRVYEWRPASAQVHEWTALGGEFVVSAGGTVSLPLLGDVPAADRAPSALATDISERLKARIGLAQRPDSAIDIVQYRPFYILGYVDKPGEYAYRPGLTVLEAIGLAGGVFRTSESFRFEREAIANRGELQVLEAERIAQLAREGRLEAELRGAGSVEFPPYLMQRADNHYVASMMRAEDRLFGARRETFLSLLESFKQLKALLQSEIKSLETKGVSIQRQLALARQELDGVSKLVDRGLVITSRKLSLDQTVAQFEAAGLDLDLAKLRAQQDISKADRDAADVVARRRNEILVDLGNVRTRLTTMDERRLTLQRLIADSEVFGPQRNQRMANPGQPLNLSIVRRAAGDSRTSIVQESDVVEPGDVVQVELRLPADAATNPQSAAAQQTVGAQATTR